MYGLGNLGHYLRSGNRDHVSVFLNQVSWLQEHALIRPDGAVVWPHDFDIQDGLFYCERPGFPPTRRALSLVLWFVVGESRVALVFSNCWKVRHGCLTSIARATAYASKRKDTLCTRRFPAFPPPESSMGL